MLNFRVTDDERRAIEDAARRLDLPRSEFLRRAALHYADCPMHEGAGAAAADTRQKGWRRRWHIRNRKDGDNDAGD